MALGWSQWEADGPEEPVKKLDCSGVPDPSYLLTPSDGPGEGPPCARHEGPQTA